MGVDAMAAILIALITGPAVAALVWQLGRRLQSAQTESAIAEGATNAVVALRSVMEELRVELADTQRESQAMRIENAKLHEQVIALRTEVERLRAIIDTAAR
jgi:hypothetical protein